MDNDDFINLDEMDEALSAFDGVAAPVCVHASVSKCSVMALWSIRRITG